MITYIKPFLCKCNVHLIEIYIMYFTQSLSKYIQENLFILRKKYNTLSTVPVTMYKKIPYYFLNQYFVKKMSRFTNNLMM